MKALCLSFLQIPFYLSQFAASFTLSLAVEQLFRQSNIPVAMQRGCSACRENLDTLGDFEKGRYIFRSYIRRRTRVRQSVRTEKASTRISR